MIAIGFSGFLAAAPTLAQETACMIEGTFSILGQTIKSRDCMQADPNENEAAFKASCDQLANTSAGMGGGRGTITYMKQCQKPAQGICKNVLGSQRDAYYYERSAEDLRILPDGCQRGGGQWQSGG
ncbi:hypothetical protein D8I35_13545 [Corticibacter populi]|uniref:Uncharacterized protein n=1 Tax=Corticibacter populi TaxID=1550736 RepID=A0A3M6QP87_9BURK|nr:hypothetical protein D8I35_13545 [Corticibacter populi]